MISANWNTLTTTPALTALSVPPDGGTPWAINANQAGDNVYFYAGPTDGWQLVSGAHLTCVAAAENGMIWGVDGTDTSDNNIYIYADDMWQQPVAGILTCIVVGLGGDIWGVNTAIDPSSDTNVFKYIGGASSWMSIPGYLTDIAIGSDGTVWGLTSYNIFKYTGDLGQPWQPYTTGAPSQLTQIAVGGDNSVWGIDGNNNIWALVEGSGFQQVNGSAVSISAGDVNNVWVVAPDGSVDTTSFPDIELTVQLNDRPVYHARYVAPGAGRVAIPGVRVPLQIAAEEWLDDRFRDAQERARQRVGKQPQVSGFDITTSEAIEIAKFAWQILKDGRPTWEGEHHTQSSVLNPSDSNWTHYVHAQPGHSETVTAEWRNGFNFVIARVKMQLAGTYNSAPQAAGLTPGYYIPDIHFDFKETKHSWGFNLKGDAQISNVSNLGGTTSDDPVNPSVTLTATLQVSSFISSASKTFYFTATGKTGFVVST